MWLFRLTWQLRWEQPRAGPAAEAASSSSRRGPRPPARFPRPSCTSRSGFSSEGCPGTVAENPEKMFTEVWFFCPQWCWWHCLKRLYLRRTPVLYDHQWEAHIRHCSLASKQNWNLNPSSLPSLHCPGPMFESRSSQKVWQIWVWKYIRYRIDR